MNLCGFLILFAVKWLLFGFFGALNPPMDHGIPRMAIPALQELARYQTETLERHRRRPRDRTSRCLVAVIEVLDMKWVYIYIYSYGKW